MRHTGITPIHLQGKTQGQRQRGLAHGKQRAGLPGQDKMAVALFAFHVPVSHCAIQPGQACLTELKRTGKMSLFIVPTDIGLRERAVRQAEIPVQLPLRRAGCSLSIIALILRHGLRRSTIGR